MQTKDSQIRKEKIVLKTYPFSDPSPVAEFGRLYPYNRFDGYTAEGVDMEWEMVIMENDYIKLWINPAVGGKVWGAIEKATGKEFIYFNNVVKFRDVAMRGPWTSGGIETNMGIIGHTPSCSSAVDHYICENTDGSVSCFIGATDWPSRTVWRVEVILPKDAAYFKTTTSWYNNSPLEQAYYQWTNAGVKVTGNLEYIFPGNKRIGHDGAVLNWPKDEEDNQINLYDKNNFGEYKSYHVFGSYADFWGCYWHDDDFGMAHYSSYHDKPGKKIWIWGLSRYGMIWQDLLTDSDGQYTEVQSGRMFNQSIATSSKTPFKHRSFLPSTFDSWNEYWFPVKQTKGITCATPQFSLNITKEIEGCELHLCANEKLNDTLQVVDDNIIKLSGQIQLQPMEVATFLLDRDIDVANIKISLNNTIVFDATEVQQPLQRPIKTVENFDHESVQGLYIQAKEWERQRFFARAIEKYISCLQKDPNYIPALNGYASQLFRQMDYDAALQLVRTALSIDTYQGETNYLYGLINDRLGNIVDAQDGFSIATQSVEYRAAAYTELSKINIRKKQLSKAAICLEKALEYNTNNRQALQLQIVIERLRCNYTNALKKAQSLILTDPLDHIARYEEGLLKSLNQPEFQKFITSELAYETYIEIAVFYRSLLLYYDADNIIQFSPPYAMAMLWRASLQSVMGNNAFSKQLLEEAALANPILVFPHRSEDIIILRWAIANNNSWKFKYYLALAYRQLLNDEQSLQLLESCKDEPDFYPFYIVRANLKKARLKPGCEEDLLQAQKHAPTQWRAVLLLSKYYSENNQWLKALEIVRDSFALNETNYHLGLQLAKCLLFSSKIEEGISLLNKLRVLPNEGASDGRIIWRETHLQAALNAIKSGEWNSAIDFVHQARLWPENLGVGKPYIVDERIEDFLEIFCKQQLRHDTISLIERIILYREAIRPAVYSSRDIITVLVLRAINKYEQADIFLSNWLNEEPENLVVLWAKAFIDKNISELDVLNNQNLEVKEPLPYEIIIEDRDFAFVKTFYKSGILLNTLASLRTNNFQIQFV